MAEKNYDFRLRHWQYHRPGMRQSDRAAKNNEVWLDESWKIGCPADAEYITRFAVKDFQDYLETSMALPLALTHEKAPMFCGWKSIPRLNGALWWMW